MQKTFKQALSVLLAILLLVGAAPVGALAEIELPTLPNGAATSRVNNGAGAVKGAAKRLSRRWNGLSLQASAATYSGNCGADGDNVKWTFDASTGTLTISGTGEMYDYENFSFDGDGTVTLKDAALISRYLVGGWNVTIDADAADVDDDGSVTLRDAALIQHFIVGGWGVVLR